MNEKLQLFKRDYWKAFYNQSSLGVYEKRWGIMAKEDNRDLIQIGVWACIAIVVIVFVVRYFLLR